MTLLHYSLRSKEYKTSILSGFSQLQKQDEFVDLILAVNGCMVKAHRNVVALASPYLREILKSIPGPFPVIYLYNVSEKVLSYLLEYIYQGEVNIPEDCLEKFIEVSESLHIAGIDSLRRKETCQPEVTAKIRRPPEKRADNIDSEIISDDDVSEIPHLQNIDYAQLNLQDHLKNQLVTPGIENIEKQIEPEQGNELSTNITENMPVIEITANDTNHLHTNNASDYKIIVKTCNTVNQETNSEALNHIPVIEIQHMNPTQHDQEMTIEDDLIIPMAMDHETLRQDENIEVMNLDETDQATPQIDRPVINTLGIMAIGTVNLQTNPTQAMNTVNVQTEASGIIPAVLNEATTTSISMSDIKADMNDLKHMAQYSVSERGCLQMILNRYIYSVHNTSRKKQRFRCIEYRRAACPALVDTQDGAIVARRGLHGHPFHDTKIYKKHKQGLIFSTNAEAQAAKEAKDKEELRTIKLAETNDEENFDKQDEDLFKCNREIDAIN